MEESNEKFYEEAAKAQTVEDLMKLAEAYDVETTEDEARLFLSLQNSEGALSDKALDDVSGGGLHYKGHLIVTSWHKCDHFRLRRRIPDGYKPHCDNCVHADYGGLFMVCKIN